MIFKNAMSYKATINEVAKSKNISAQQVSHIYMIETFLTKISKSKYKKNFIVKGGYLISSFIGIDIRTTMDLDTTIKGISLSDENILKIVNEIIQIPTNDSFKFEVKSLKPIREKDEYGGKRLKLKVIFEHIIETISVDITTGDVITPKEIKYTFEKIMDNESIELFSYPLETVLSEKIETILSWGVFSTRPRDYYDVFILSRIYYEKIDFSLLEKALYKTMKKRKTFELIYEYKSILKEIADSRVQQKRWYIYQKEYYYANDLDFGKVILSIENLLNEILT